ncbi:hypothetical protein J0H58_35820 [bacterium]|nr:hypothetical protein [bacterium]
MREGTDDALLAAIAAAPRALVFLTVPWSCPERTARADFRKAVARLAEFGLVVEAFAVDEEAELAQRWLGGRGVPEPYGRGVPIGWGSVLWLEAGRLVGFVCRGIDERAIGLIGRSRALWGGAAEPRAAADGRLGSES